MKKQNEVRTVFMGTSDLSENILNTLIAEKYNIVGVFTKPDAKVGRKQEIFPPAVKILALKNNIPVFGPQKFKTKGLEDLRKLSPDLVIVAAYGKILPEEALQLPKYGCINVHVSLLPKYRGASPVQNALLAGETETGVTIMLMDKGIDTGDILLQEKISIDPDDNTETLMNKLAHYGAAALIRAIPLWLEGGIKPKIQDHTKATYCQMINRQDGHINWNSSAKSILNKYRGFSPWPGIFSFMEINGKAIRLKLTKIELRQNSIVNNNFGEIIKNDNDICIQALDGLIVLKEIQKEGKKIMDIKSFLSGHSNFIGSFLK